MREVCIEWQASENGICILFDEGCYNLRHNLENRALEANGPKCRWLCAGFTWLRDQVQLAGKPVTGWCHLLCTPVVFNGSMDRTRKLRG